MKHKGSQTILYLIFATISILIFVYYLLSDNKSITTDVNTKSTVQSVGEILSEVNFDQLSNIVTDTKFSNIVII